MVIIICFVSAWTGALASVLNRRLKDTPASVIIFYHATLGLIIVGTYILIEAYLIGNGFRFNDYTGRMYLIVAGSIACDSLELFMMTIAF